MAAVVAGPVLAPAEHYLRPESRRWKCAWGSDELAALDQKFLLPLHAQPLEVLAEALAARGQMYHWTAAGSLVRGRFCRADRAG